LPRILFVDDDQVWGEAAAAELRRNGYEVCLAPDYRLALTELDSGRPIDLLITDIVMPKNVNGVALSRMARMRRHDLKIMYVSAYDIPGADEEALGPILRKPIAIDRLASEVEKILAT
jgi:CheY-like chemotaxis protein